jgi:hypothetical protein
VRYLIDGYNLAYKMDLLTAAARAPQQLERARVGLLAQVRSGLTVDAAATVVFDAREAPPGLPPRQDTDGIAVLFAQGQSADDLIEDLVRREPAPQQLTVVSDDRRVRDAGRRRGCPVLGCLDFLEMLTRPGRPPSAIPGPAAKPVRPAGEDASYWLEQFGHIDRDPKLSGFDLPFRDPDEP